MTTSRLLQRKMECYKDIQNDNFFGIVSYGRSLEKGSFRACLDCKQASSCKQNDSPTFLYFPRYCKLYNNSPETLLKTYETILKLNITNTTAMKVLKIVAKIGIKFNNLKSIQILLDYLGIEPTVETYVIGKFKLFKIVKDDILGNADDFSIANYVTPMYDSFCIALAKMILRKYENLDEAFEEITHLPFFTPNVTFRNWLCKYLCSYFIRFYSFKSEIDVAKYKKALTQGIENLRYPILLNNMLLFDIEDYVFECNDYESLPNPNDIEEIEAVFIMKCLYLDRKWIYIETFISEFLRKAKDKYIINELRVFLLISYAEQKKWEEGVVICFEVPHNFLDCYQKFVLAKCYIENGYNDDYLMKYLEKTKYYQQLRALILMKQEKYDEIIKWLDKDTKNPMEIFYIATAYWKLFEWDLAYTYFNKAVELDCNCADIFYHFALYYEETGMYHHKFAKKCLERAYFLNNADLEIIKTSCEFYAKYGYKEELMELLIGASQYLVKEPWIYYRIGVQLMRCNQSERSIEYLRKAIQYDPKHIYALISLAEACHELGYLENAIIYYFRLIHFDPQYRLEYLTNIGVLRAELKHFDRAILTFEQVLAINPNYSNAISGLTATYVKYATTYANLRHYQTARDTSQTAINYLITSLSNGISCKPFWNILGQALTLIAKLPDEYCFVDIGFDNNVGPGNLGTLYAKKSIYLLIYYSSCIEKVELPSNLEIQFGRKIGNEILEEEESSNVIRDLCPPDLGMGYVEWVENILSDNIPWSSIGS